VGVRVEVQMTIRTRGLSDRVQAALVRGETLAAERGMALAVDLSPMDIGTLIGAHQVVPAETPEEGAAVVVDTPYAARLHEHPEYNFATDANPNAQGKWVETAMVENRKELGDIIRKEVTDAL
jgi:hypothetical protein